MLGSVTPLHMSGHETHSGPVVHNGSHHYQGWCLESECCFSMFAYDDFLTWIRTRRTRSSKLPSQSMARTNGQSRLVRHLPLRVLLTPRH